MTRIGAKVEAAVEALDLRERDAPDKPNAIAAAKFAGQSLEFRQDGSVANDDEANLGAVVEQGHGLDQIEKALIRAEGAYKPNDKTARHAELGDCARITPDRGEQLGID